MKSTKYLFITVVLFLILPLTNCNLLNLFGNNSGTEKPGYYSKEVEVNRYVDTKKRDLEPVESYIYDENGILSDVFKNIYEDVNGDGYYLNTRTNIYQADKNGNKTLIQYYKYTYRKDTYEYVDDEGTTQTDHDYELLTGEVYSANETPDDETDDIKVNYYTVTYTPDSTTVYEEYTSIIDYDKNNNVINRQDDTYIDDTGSPIIIAEHSDLRYRTEKYYSLDDPADFSSLSL